MPTKMSRSIQEGSDSLMNIEKESTNGFKQVGTVPKKLLLDGEQCSQEENYIIDKSRPLNSCHISQNEETTHNNNFIAEKTNKTCSDDKYVFYHKFPLKVNNNIYPEVIPLKKDGMEEYFEQNAARLELGTNHGLNSANSAEVRGKVGGIDRYQEEINALNGDDDDEDNGCFYTYKGDNYESNLSKILDTCFSCGLPISVRSLPSCGVLSIQRILNGSSVVKYNENGSLYSPEMDFLEMDFDPGSCGDNADGVDSECEDNNILNIDEKSVEIRANNSEVLQVPNKSNNIQNIRSLMCLRCEMCYYNENEQKVNNTSDNKISKPNKCNTNVVVNDIQENESNSIPLSNTCNFQTNKNYESENNFKQNGSNTLNKFVNLSLCHDNLDKESIENNLNCIEDYEHLTDDGEDADDEQDDSVSEHYDAKNVKKSIPLSYSTNCDNICYNNALHSQMSNNYKEFSSIYSVPKKSNINISKENSITNGFSVLKGSTHYDVKVCNKSHTMNNNLGSISAPEISPTKEYSCDDKFTRSFSFHNQLSSPKYENVCISNKHKENIPNCGTSRYPDCEGCSCTSIAINNELEASNKEACSDRLSQRGISVFNVGAMSYNHSMNSNFKNIQTASPTLAITTNHCRPRVCSFSSANESELMTSVASLPLKTVPTMSEEDPNADPKNTTKECYDRMSPGIASTIEKVMIWTEFQAAYRQVVQVDTSACGATSVLNVLLALDEARSVKEVMMAVKTRQRAENASLVEYMLSRSNAGATHQDLIEGVDEISKGSITSRFFHMYPKRSFQLTRWLSHWIQKGGVPVATLNLQVGVYPRQTVPDAWHHQMVFGVGPLGVYLTNPLECVSVTLLSDQLCSNSVLLVRRSDVVSHWDKKDQLIKLSLHDDSRWNDMNVLGQVVGVLKEETAPEKFQGRCHLTSHVSIPAAYQSGVTIFMRSDNSNVNELKSVSELPLLDE